MWCAWLNHFCDSLLLRTPRFRYWDVLWNQLSSCCLCRQHTKSSSKTCTIFFWCTWMSICGLDFSLSTLFLLCLRRHKSPPINVDDNMRATNMERYHSYIFIEAILTTVTQRGITWYWNTESLVQIILFDATKWGLGIIKPNRHTYLNSLAAKTPPPTFICHVTQQILPQLN